MESHCVPECAPALWGHHLAMDGHFLIELAFQSPAIEPVMDAPQEFAHDNFFSRRTENGLNGSGNLFVLSQLTLQLRSTLCR
jgi:hypothetical protein